MKLGCSAGPRGGHSRAGWAAAAAPVDRPVLVASPPSQREVSEIFYLGYLEYLRAVVLPPSARSLQIFDRKLLVRPLHVTSAVTIVSL